MSDEEARSKLLASMGIKRRDATPDVADDAEPEEIEVPSADEADEGMAPAAPPEAPKKDARAGLGLGSRREKPAAEPAARKTSAERAAASEAEVASAPAAEAAPPTVRLGNDQSAEIGRAHV